MPGKARVPPLAECKQADEQHRMANFEAAALRGGSHFAHGCVLGRLFGITKPHYLRLALHKMALRRRREIYVYRPQIWKK